MERTQQILLHRILQADLVCDLMIEEFVNVPAFQIVVSFIRGCGHTKPQLWFEIVQDFFVAVGGAVMGFVDYDCIKCVLLIAVQVLLFAQGLFTIQSITANTLLSFFSLPVKHASRIANISELFIH